MLNIQRVIGKLNQGNMLEKIECNGILNGISNNISGLLPPSLLIIMNSNKDLLGSH
jgi:hypothetical protein